MDNLQSVSKLLKHYFGVVWRKAGVKWDSDNNAEMDEIGAEIVAEIKYQLTKDRADFRKEIDDVITKSGLVCKEFFDDFLTFQKNRPVIKLDKKATLSGTNAAGKSFSYSYDYATLDEILKKCLPVLNKNNLIIYWQTGESGQVTCILEHASGEKRESTLIIESDPKDAKKKGAAITYARRYTLSALLGITTETDNDAPEGEEKGKVKLSKKAYETAVIRIQKGEDFLVNKIRAEMSVTWEQEQGLINAGLENQASKL